MLLGVIVGLVVGAGIVHLVFWLHGRQHPLAPTYEDDFAEVNLEDRHDWGDGTYSTRRELTEAIQLPPPESTPRSRELYGLPIHHFRREGPVRG